MSFASYLFLKLASRIAGQHKAIIDITDLLFLYEVMWGTCHTKVAFKQSSGEVKSVSRIAVFK